MKVGAAFSDAIYTEGRFLRKSRKSSFHNTDDEIRMRGFLFPLLLIVSSIILFGRVFYLQIIQGDTYRLLSDTNRTRTTVIYAPRGIIFDRNGKSLVFNTPGFRQIENGQTKLVDAKTGISLLAAGDRHLEIDSLRSYPFHDAFSHVIGYIGQISKDELADPDYIDYRVDDVVGKMGIEQKYERLLKGTNGQQLAEVNALGNPVRTLGQTDPVPGQNITTTLDENIQLSAYEAMNGVQKGAVIVSKPNGEILAMVSKPSFDPNLFTMGLHYEATESAYQSIDSVLLDNTNQPLLNRAIGGTYPPGSTFKLVVAAAGLEQKKIDENYTVDDTGIVKIGDFSFSNWYYSQYGRTEGTINVVQAIKRSNDIFFYKLGDLLGVDTVSEEAGKFGAGKKLGIDLPGEQPGLLPTKAWKQKTFGDKWYLGDNYLYGIGQGYILTTPLQVNSWTQAIANEGTLYVPHLLQSQKSKIKSQKLLSEKNFELIRQGMIEACSPGGVAWPLFDFRIKNQELRMKVDGKDFFVPQDATDSAKSNNEVGVSIACKTGTAQHGNDQTLPHAWITLFAPAYHPQIVVTVLAESSGEGSNIAAPIAKKILEGYFGK